MDTLYMNLFDSTTSMGWINATISSVQAYGNVALVHTVEEVGERLMPQTSSISYVTKTPTPLAPGIVRLFCCNIMLPFNFAILWYCYHIISFFLATICADLAEGAGNNRVTSMQQPVAHCVSPCSAHVEQSLYRRPNRSNILETRRAAPSCTHASTFGSSKSRRYFGQANSIRRFDFLRILYPACCILC